MKISKKFLVILLALSMLFLAAGCGDKDVQTLASVDVAQQESTLTTEAGQTVSLSYPVDISYHQQHMMWTKCWKTKCPVPAGRRGLCAAGSR